MAQTVYTLIITSDGENDVRVFKTEAARDSALIVEAQHRFQAALKIDAAEDWTADKVAEAPDEFINDVSYGDTYARTDAVKLEG